jgi:hypothetical protein
MVLTWLRIERRAALAVRNHFCAYWHQSRGSRTNQDSGSCVGVSVPSFLKVECYAGYKPDERPLRFSFVTTSGKSDLTSERSVIRRARTYHVTEVLDRWYGPDYECFRVRADDRNLYVLRHHFGQDTWSLDSFRRESNLPSDLGLQSESFPPTPSSRT